jgi:hypothetical protein
MNQKIILTIVAILIFTGSYSQKVLKDYEESYYVTFSGTHPGQVIHKGNNWDILVAFKNGGKLEKLNELKIEYSQKQIDILCALNFLDKKDDTYRTLVTILNETDTKEIRTFTKEIAVNISNLIKNDFLKLENELKQKGFENNTYTILFSYIMDNIVWDLFEQNNILPEKDITVEKPIWDGTIWFNYPKRKFQCGTNSRQIDNLVFATNWTEDSELSLKDLDKKSTLNELINNSKISDNDLIKLLKPYGVCDDKGNILIPYLGQESSLDIIKHSESIAETIYKYLVNNVDFTELNAKFNIQSKGDAIIIVYHDIMWDIMDIFENDGLIKKPIAFSNPGKAVASDLKDLLIIYDQKRLPTQK